MYEKGDDDGSWTENSRNNLSRICSYFFIFIIKVFNSINIENNSNVFHFRNFKICENSLNY